jgi:hypothetical protein
MRVTRARVLVLAAVVLSAGCADVTQRIPSFGLSGLAGNGPTASEVHDALANWTASFAALVTAASDRIRAETKQRETRRHTLLWQLRMIPLARQAAFRQDPQEGFVAVLATATAQHHYLTEGEGRGLFGPQQAIAVEVAEQLEASALAIGRSFLSEAQARRLQAQVDELVAEHPIRGVFSADALVQGFAASSAGGMFTWVVDLPMVPFRALSGVSDTAQAVQSFNETAREFTQSVNELPNLTRWELELLLYDTEELESLNRALDAAESIAEGAERISGTAENLPAALGAELAARLADARSTIAELDAALVRADKLAKPLEHVADRLGDASAQWTALLAEMRRGDGKPEGRPFDVREYDQTAGRISEAGHELRALVAELNALDAGGARALLDAAAWRAAGLIVVFFAALAAYRFATSRMH